MSTSANKPPQKEFTPTIDQCQEFLLQKIACEELYIQGMTRSRCAQEVIKRAQLNKKYLQQISHYLTRLT